MRPIRFVIFAAMLFMAAQASAQVPYTFSPGTPAKAAEVNANFSYLDSRIIQDLNSNTAVGFGALRNNLTGTYNTAFGNAALASSTVANGNIAIGSLALQFNNGQTNTAVGVQAMQNNATGGLNVAVGGGALINNSTADYNVAVGVQALRSATSGYANTALGTFALQNLTTGFGNIGVGNSAGANLTTSNRNIDVGSPGVPDDEGVIRIGMPPYQSRTFIAGIYGSATSLAGVPVVVDGNGQLGTTSSSRRFKDDISDMGNASDDLMRLRPVTFRYKQSLEDGGRPPHYGLIAEEVEEVYPNLVARDASGEPMTVLYQELPSLLLNELQKQHAKMEGQNARIAELEKQNAALQATVSELADLRSKVDSLIRTQSEADRP
jgi:hypothetical protein